MIYRVGATVSSTLMLLFCAQAAAHNLPIHRSMADHAMERVEAGGDFCALTQQYKDEIFDGSWHEDMDSEHDHRVMDPCRNKNHGYNPITGGTAAWFADVGQPACCAKLGKPPTCTDPPLRDASQRARELWDDMEIAFANDVWTGGDGVGAFHYLGRVAHMLHDVSSFPHVHPQEISGLEHKDFEDAEEDRFANEDWLPVASPLYPTDPIPSEATDKLDIYSAGRLAPAGDDEVESFIDLAARITYFRATFYGQVVFGSSSSGPATTAMTDETDFDDATVGPQDNVLHVMFGAGNVEYVTGFEGDYFRITDDDGNGSVHTWGSVAGDEWFPAAGGSQDGHKTIPDSGDPTDPGDRTTGRFFFSNPYPGTWPHQPVVPVNHPDGTAFSHANLGEYISDYSMRIALRYNAGLIGKAVAANVGTSTGGDDPSGVQVRGEFDLQQNEASVADQLSFVSYNVDADINGWCVGMDTFSDSTSSRDSARRVNVQGLEAGSDVIEIPNGDWVNVKVTQWATQWNTMGYDSVEWRAAQSASGGGGGAGAGALQAGSRAIPNHHWSFDPPVEIPGQPQVFRHTFTIKNTDSDHSLRVTGLQFEPSLVFEPILSRIVFSGPSTDPPVLDPDESWSTDIVETTGDFAGGSINFKYGVYNAAGDALVFNGWGSHPVVSLPHRLEIHYDVPVRRVAGSGVGIDAASLAVALVTDPPSPIISLRAVAGIGRDTWLPTASSPPPTLTFGWTTPGAGLTRSSLPVTGMLRVCLLDSSCGVSVAAPLTVNQTRGVGIGGLLTARFGGIGISIEGAPWTVGPVSLFPVLTTNGATGTLADQGFVHGAASETSLTANGTGVLQLLTPIVVSTNLSGVAVGGFARMTLRFVPEPGMWLLLLPGVLGLALMRRMRRRS